VLLALVRTNDLNRARTFKNTPRAIIVSGLVIAKTNRRLLVQAGVPANGD